MKLQNHKAKPAWIIGPSSRQSAMVAFSFIAALNSRTLAEAPVVIDSPTGKLDTIHRRNLVKHWATTVQTVLVVPGKFLFYINLKN